MSGIVQDAVDIAINKEVKSPCLYEIYILVDDKNISKQVKCIVLEMVISTVDKNKPGRVNR